MALNRPLRCSRKRIYSGPSCERLGESAMRCSKCGTDNREGRKFCTQCGSALAAKCPRCGAAIEPAEKFCGECGAALGTPSAAIGKSDEPQIRLADTPADENL